jgi:hypothetical protein
MAAGGGVELGVNLNGWKKGEEKRWRWRVKFWCSAWFGMEEWDKIITNPYAALRISSLTSCDVNAKNNGWAAEGKRQILAW